MPNILAHIPLRDRGPYVGHFLGPGSPKCSGLQEQCRSLSQKRLALRMG